MHSKYISFDRGQCRGYQSEIDLYSRFIHTHILQNIPTYSDILKEETKFVEYLALANGVSTQNQATSSARSDTAGNAVFLNDISLHFLAMTIVSTYNLWERQIINHLQLQLEFNDIFIQKSYWTWETIISTLSEYSTPKNLIPSYSDLQEMQLITNAIKQGQGSSYDELLASGAPITIEPPTPLPETFFGTPLLGIRLYPTREIVHTYISATKDFWDYSHWEQLGPQRPANTTSSVPLY
ncbi:hypothetical protein [Fundidesulfovibrio putealis]|uniref:hypothetical protein n=1 Tax=Fundidesulfovibrio putealis TaxID=270496 RepID=UPI000481B6AE|nr:hypothetical protein [Fundidesulfovibrio putealis]